MAELTDDASLREVLRHARVIAIVGASDRPAAPACYVPAYLARVGYTVLPVNPLRLGIELWGQPVRATLVEAAAASPAPIDLVDVFRRSSAVEDHVDDILAMSPRPAVVWLQLGIRNRRAADRLLAAGVDVVQDRCTLAEHRRLLGAAG